MLLNTNRLAGDPHSLRVNLPGADYWSYPVHSDLSGRPSAMGNWGVEPHPAGDGPRMDRVGVEPTLASFSHCPYNLR
jgi:hypothetical protein